MIERNAAFLLALDLRGKNVLVAGTGDEALKRAAALTEAGALVTILSPAPEAALSGWARENHILLVTRDPESADVQGMWLVVLADHNPRWAAVLGPAALAERVFFCAVDQPEFNTFSHVAIARAGPLQVGISSGGRAPAVSGALRREIAHLLERANLEGFVERCASLRDSLEPPKRGELLRAMAAQIRIVGSLELPTLSEMGDPE